MTNRIPPCSGYEASDADLDEPGQISVRALPEYDDSWLAEAVPMSFIDWRPRVVLPMTGLDEFRAELESQTYRLSRQIVQIHEDYLIRRAEQELVEEAYGRPMFRLCEREIPARGQE